jgi:DNA-binding IclR family transcriptional regulator
MTDRELVPALSKGIRILDTLAEAEEPMTLTRLSTAIGAAKSTTSNLCSVLEQQRLIHRRRDGYALGRRALELGGSYLQSFDQLREFYEVTSELPHLRRQLVKVAMLDGTDVLYLARHEGRAPLRLSASIGDRFPAASTAVGNILLARLPADDLEQLFADMDSFPRLTAHSTKDLDELRQRVDLARSQGYAEERGAILDDVHGLAVALPAARAGDPDLAIGASFVASRTDEATRAEILAETQELRDRLSNPLRP